jgi:hypothetical protein
MADGIDADFSQVSILAVNIGRATAAGITAAQGVVAKGALNIKQDTRKNISDHPSWKRLEQTVNYEQVGLSAVIGYDDVGQGELAGIYEFGSAKRAPHPTLYPAAAREVPNFEKAIAEAAARATEATL